VNASPRLAHLVAPVSEAQPAEPESGTRVAAIRPRLARRGVPPMDEDTAVEHTGAVGRLKSDETAPQVQVAPPTIAPRDADHHERPLVAHVTIERAIAPGMVAPPAPIDSGEERDRRSSATPPPPRTQPVEPANARGVSSASRPPRDGAPPPLARNAAEPPHADRAAVAPRASRPDVQPLIESKPKSPEQQDRRVTTPEDSRTWSPPPVQPAAARVEHPVAVAVASPRHVAPSDTALAPPRAPAPATLDDDRAAASRELEPRAAAPHDSRASVAPIDRRDGRPSGGPRPPVAITPAATRPSAPPVASKTADASTSVSIRIGRVEIVATAPKVTAARPAKRPARVVRPARRHQIEPRLPIPPGRW
jgi:hypothetical protein